MKTNKELKKLAIDIHAGRVFTDRHCKSEEAPSTFIPLFFMEPEALQKMIDKEISLIYEYMTEAGPKTINGRPMFSSFHTLTKPEHEKMIKYFAKLEKTIKEL